MARGQGGRKRSDFQRYFRAGAARSRERVYMRDKKTRAAIMKEKLGAVTDILSRFIQSALVGVFSVTSEQMEQIQARVDAASEWYMGMRSTNGKEYADDLLKKRVEVFLPDNFWMPNEVIFAANELTTARGTGSFVCQVWCLAVHEVLDFGKDELTKVLDKAKELHEGYIAHKGEEVKD